MKIMTVLGTRPEIIRLSLIIKKLDNLCDHTLIHTGQNYHYTLSESFFKELELREPDHYLGIQGDTPGMQIGKILEQCENIFLKNRPDKLLLLGDTNSSLCAIMAKRLKIPVYHMEAGNRCYDDRVPEEINRRLIDHVSDILMPYTERSRANLIREGMASNRICVTGNPIKEVLDHYQDKIEDSNILKTMNLKEKNYFLVTLHRAENVDIESRLVNVIEALTQLNKIYKVPVIISTHPRTRVRMKEFNIPDNNPDLRFVEPFGFFDFIKLERNAKCVLSDSGTVQEECAIFGVPNVTIRDVTERPETIECGSNLISGIEVQSVLDCVKASLMLTSTWNAPPEYLVPNVSETVIRILHGYY